MPSNENSIHIGNTSATHSCNLAGCKGDCGICQPPQPTQHVCPNCGYCPCCGRRNASPPYVYPWYPQPTWTGPYWTVSGTITRTDGLGNTTYTNMPVPSTPTGGFSA